MSEYCSVSSRLPGHHRLTFENSENCVKLKVTKYVTDIKQLTKTM